MSASCPLSARSTWASTVASPHSRRWLPSAQRSPGRLTGSSGGSGTSSSASSEPASPPAIASSRSGSVALNPRRSRSNFSSLSQPVSSASRSRVKCELLHTPRPPSSDILALCRTEPYGESRLGACLLRGKRLVVLAGAPHRVKKAAVEGTHTGKMKSEGRSGAATAPAACRSGTTRRNS
jgi:hypothetical protein